MRRRVSSLALVVLLGCGEDTTKTDAPACEQTGDCPCEGPDCTPDTVECPTGFVENTFGGCRADIPDEACAPGTMALPGEICREVAACAEGPYGAIPPGEPTQHVDQSYPNDDSDGSAARPFKTITEAFAAAAPNDVIAIAAGTYAETLLLDRPARLWGRCPAMTEIRVEDDEAALIFASDSLEIHDLALAGAGTGVLMTGGDLTIDGSWIHDLAEIGVVVLPLFGTSSVAVRDSLFEGIGEAALNVVGLELAVERTAIRNIGSPEVAFGYGVFALAPSPDAPGRLTLVDSVIRTSIGSAIGIFGMPAELRGVAIVATAANADGLFGDGLSVQTYIPDTVPVLATLRIEDAWLAHNARAGLAGWGAEVAVGTTTFECQPIDINGEPDIFGAGADPTFDNLGDNHCGCGTDSSDCAVRSAGLQPPPPPGGSP